MNPFKLNITKIDTMLQGGIRPGEMVSIGSIDSKVRENFALVVLSHLFMNNDHEPSTERESGKRALMLHVSLNRDKPAVFRLIQDYLEPFGCEISPLRVVENNTPWLMVSAGLDDFDLGFIDVDPEDWSILKFVEKFQAIESLGYVIKVVLIDELDLLPKVENDKLAFLNQVRLLKNFLAKHSVTCILPLAMEDNVRVLVYSGHETYDRYVDTSEDKRCYYKRSSVLMQELDLEIYLHEFNGKYEEKFVGVRRGKHRIPTLISEYDMFVVFKYTNNIGLPWLYST